MNMRVAPSGGGWFVASSQPSPSNQPANDPKLQEFLGRINSELQKLSLPVIDVSSLQKAEESYRHQAASLYSDDVQYLPKALFTLMAIHDTLSRRSDLNLNFLLREIEGKIKTLRQQGAQNALMNEYQLTLDQIPLADAEPMLRERRIKEYLNNNSKLLNELATALQAIDPTLTEEQAKEDATERLQSHIKEEGFPGYHSMYKGWRIDVKEVRAHIRQEITRISNAAVTRRPTDPGLVDVVYPDFGSLLEALKLNGYQHLETQLSFPVVVRLPNGTEIGAATLILHPETQSRAGVVVSFEQDQVITHEGVAYTVPGVVLEMIPETVHLENQGNPENLITVGPITWRMRTAGEEGRQFLEALNTPDASVTLTVPRGFLDNPRDLGAQMVSLATYDWANPHPPYTSPEDMARMAMDWVKSQPGGNRDLLRIIAEEIYQGYRGQENGQDNAIEAVQNFLVSVAEIEDFDDSTERDPVTQRSRVLDAVYHSLIEVARTDPRLLIAWLEQISAVDATNEQGQHVGRAVRTEQGEVVEGGYNLQAGIDTIAALAELTNYPEVLAVLKDQLSGLLKANRALEHERYLVLSRKALGKLLPGLDLEGVNLFHANLSRANLSGANLQNANLSGAILNGVNLNGANLNGAILAGAIVTPQTLEEIRSLISEHGYDVPGLNSVTLLGPNVVLMGWNLSDADLRETDLTGANLHNVNLQNANLQNANLQNAYLSRANLTRANLRGANLTEANLTRANLRGADLNGVNLTGAILNGAILNGANLSGANLTRTKFSGANLSEANLSGANLSGAILNGVNLNGANLNGANLAGAIVTPQTLEEIRSLISEHGYDVPGLNSVTLLGPNANLSNADLSGANLSGANLTRTKFSEANLSGANLSGANLSGADLTNANLIRAVLTNANLTNADLNGANVTEANLRGADLNGVNLTGVNLTYANLSEANLSEANLSGANLSGVNLTEANLNGMNLTGMNLFGANLTRTKLGEANLTNADLNGANLNEADLTNTNLFEANLRGANLRGANLSEANLSGANLTRTKFSEANLSGANLSGANLSGAILNGVNLNGANLNGANLAGAIVTPQTLEEIRSLISEHGYDVPGLNSVTLLGPNANLSNADLSGVYLYQAYLSRANLQNASLQGTILIEADLSSANLQGTNLTEANLISANLSSANLRYANLSSANLRYANLQGAALTGANVTGADLTGAALTGADFRGAILSPEQTQYISSRGGIVDQAQPPTSEHRLLTDPPGDNEILPQPTNPVRRISGRLDNLPPPSPAGPTERAVRSLPNEPTPGLVIGGDTIPTPEENLQLLRDLGIDPTGIRPDLLDDPTLKNLLREFRHTGDKEKARAKIAEWLKLKGVDLTPLALPPHTGDDKKQRDPEIPTNPPPFPDLSNVPDSRLPVPKEQPADPPLTQALSNLKNSDDPARLMREWSEAGDRQLKALLTFEGLQQVLAYGLEGKLLKGLRQYNLSRFLSAYNTENVLSRIIKDPEVSSTVKALAQKMLSSVKNVLNEARLAPFKSALAELERRPPEDRTALILGWAKERDPRLLLLLGTEQGLRLVLDAGMGGSFLTALAQGYSGWLRHLNTANLLQKLAQENPGTPLGTAAQNLLSRVNNVLRAATTPPQRAAERTDNLPLASKVEQPNLIKPITPSALDSSVQALRQAKTPEQRLEALNVVRTTLQELLNLMTMNPNEQLQGLSLMQQQFVGLIIEKLQEALKWVNDPQREKDAAYIAQGTWEFAVSGLSALAASIGFFWSLRPDGTS